MFVMCELLLVVVCLRLLTSHTLDVNSAIYGTPLYMLSQSASCKILILFEKHELPSIQVTNTCIR